MTDTSLFLSTRPAYPWSVYPIGLPALGVVALLLVLLTLWSYLGHPAATRRRVFAVLALRLAALAVALLTAVRPSVGVQEEPKVPSVLLIGVDTSESMTVKDEVNNQPRAEAVRRALDRAKPVLDELAAEQNVTVVPYAFNGPDFSPDTSRYEADTPSNGKRSDYGTYLNRTFERWQGERFIRGHLLLGDGADNGTAFAAAAEAARWGRRNAAITTFTVGAETTSGTARDIAVVALSCDPSPAPVKTEVTVTARVHAYGFAGTKVRARVLFDDKEVASDDVVLQKDKDNEVKLLVKAPEKHGEVKVKVEVGRDAGGTIEPLPGEVSGLNNQSETYLTVTKEGVRVLVIDQYRPENARLLDALRSEKRFDVVAVWRQAPFPAAPEDRSLLDLEAQGYDVVVIGNMSYELLASADPRLPAQLVDRVVKKGMGLMFLGGEAAFTGYPAPRAGAPGLAVGDLLPVVPEPGVIIETAGKDGRALKTYQCVPTAKGLDDHVLTLDRDPARSRELWDQLNAGGRPPRPRISGLVKTTRKPAATLFAWATNEDAVVPAGGLNTEKVGTAVREKGDPLLVGHQIGDGNKGRVLAFAGYDTYLWERLGQPKTRQGTDLHHRFWRQCVLWLAHQEEEEGQVYARPEFRRLPVAGEQTIRVGVKSPTGGDDPNPDVEVKVLPPGATDQDKAPRQTVLRDAKGAKVLFRPPTAGEYTVVVTAPLKDKDGNVVPGPDGKPQRLRGTARFLAYPEVSDEMLNVAADHRFLERIAAASGGKALRLEDLSAFLRELKGQPLDTVKPKPRYLPDWRRNHSKGFLPAWLVLFVALLGVEWGLRRFWGMV
ncbi:MAG TPA: hypothetical protein VH092_22120 [Urbifossiella sp.]|jgi:hypothetical protein|nr:hypothetical protein [Urbifossiella sp.]